MEYFFILILQFIGFSVYQYPELKRIDARHPEDNFNDVFSAFWQEDKITIFGSLIVLLFQWTIHLIVEYYNWIDFSIDVIGITIPYTAIFLIAAPILGYGGQRILYKTFGKTEEYYIKKLEDKLK